MKSKLSVVALSTLLAASAASAQATPIGEFTGDMIEGFEGIFPPGGYPGPMPLFNGTATMEDTLANTCVIALSWFGPGGELLPPNGNFMGGTVAGPTLFTFMTPVTEFGGLFSTVGALPGGTVTFFDPSGSEIASLPLGVEPVVWGWQGWRSDVPIGSIEVLSANVPGVSMQYDDLRVTVVPAPGVVALAGMGVAVAARRRRGGRC